MPDDDPFSAAIAAGGTSRPAGDDPFGAALAASSRSRPAPRPPDDDPFSAALARSSVGQAIVDTAAKLAGKSAADVKPFLQQTGQALDPERMNWCAAFVNGVLAANGVEGTTGGGKNIATGFLNWGEPVQGAPRPGDVLVLPKGRSAGSLGGHVGIATGEVANGSGGTFYRMQSGNEGDRVAYTWEPARSVVARRAAPPQEQAR